MDVVVQRVRTTWTKKSRGAPGAALRNAVPDAFELPPGPPPLFQDVSVREWEGFSPEMSVVQAAPRPSEFGLRMVGAALQVRLPNGYGVPRRSYRPTVLVQRGEWVSWQLNNKWFSSRGASRYTLTTVGIALGAVPLDAFLGRASHVVDEKVELY
jgi:hypothetical protein